MGASFSITFDPVAVTACMTIFWLAAGIFLIISGWRLRRLAGVRLPRPPRKNDWQWWGRLVKWGAIGPDNAGWVVLQEFTRSYDLLISSVLLGLGLAMLLLFVGGGAILLAISGTLVSLTTLDTGQLSGIVVYPSLLLGAGLGLADGFWRLRKATTSHITYGDLQPRRLADYRSVLFRWLIVVLIALVIVETCVLAPDIGSAVSINLGHWIAVSLPTNFWILAILPATMFILLIAGEMVMARIAKLPRLLVTSDPQTAQRADNFLRALIIGLVQCYQLYTIGYLALNQDSLLIQGLWQQGFWRVSSHPYDSLSETTFFLAWSVIMLGTILPAFYGRLGGRIGGWPWRPMRITP